MSCGIIEASARGHEFAVGINGGTCLTNGDGRDPENLWQLGVQGEFRLNLFSPLWLNSIVSVDYTRFKCEEKPVTLHKNGAAFQITEYFDVRLPKGWGIGTGPAVRFDTFKFYSSNKDVKVYWTFGVEKVFADRLTARLMWNQKLNDVSTIYNQLNLSLTYTF